MSPLLRPCIQEPSDIEHTGRAGRGGPITQIDRYARGRARIGTSSRARATFELTAENRVEDAVGAPARYTKRRPRWSKPLGEFDDPAALIAVEAVGVNLSGWLWARPGTATMPVITSRVCTPCSADTHAGDTHHCDHGVDNRRRSDHTPVDAVTTSVRPPRMEDTPLQ
jgi:hypothetical protein